MEERGKNMSNEVRFYRCQNCGNLVYVMHQGSGKLVCCGSQMVELEPREGGMAADMHLPIIRHDKGRLYVSVSENGHPFTQEHYIEWIALVSPSRITIRHLKPEDQGATLFTDIEHGTIYVYCTLHKLWKKTF